MADDGDDKGGSDGSTVFRPGGGVSPPQSPPTPPERTVFRPGGSAKPEAPDWGAAGPANVPPAQPAASAPASSAAEEQISEGVILAENFRIVRRIDSGGMGRVWEAIGLHNDKDRVAIKTILPELASDQTALSMFQEEAGRLMGLEHPAITPFRGFHKDAKLDLFFIVMKFIPGDNLADVLATLHPSIQDVILVGRRLADGLGAAHAIGSIHCDVKPRNILLENGRLALARLIDFGIGHDIINDGEKQGDGFAGTLSFAAPEQFDRSLGAIGPATDVYSLGLVLAAMIRGRNVDMGGTFEEAIQRRIQGPDLSGIPKDMQAVLRRMLAYKPQDRIKTMSEVSAALARCGGGGTLKRLLDTLQSIPGLSRGGGRIAVIAGAIGLAVVIALVLLLPGPHIDNTLVLDPRATAIATGGPAPAPAQSIDKRARDILAQVATRSPCAWVNSDVVPTGGGVNVNLSGAARDRFAAQKAVEAGLRDGGIAVPSMSAGDLLDMDPRDCALADAYASVRATGAHRLALEGQSTWAIQDNRSVSMKFPDGQSSRYAIPLAHLTIANPTQEFAVVVINEGEASVIVEGRATIEKAIKSTHLSRLENDSYRIKLPWNKPGKWGVILVTSDAPMPLDDLMPKDSAATATWAASFAATARAKGWQTEAVWFAITG